MNDKSKAKIVYDDDFLRWVIIVDFKNEELQVGNNDGIAYKYKTKGAANRWLKRRNDKFIICNEF